MNSKQLSVSGEQFSGARWQAKMGTWLMGVLLVAVSIRLASWAAYQPVAYSDSPSYRRLALAILDGWDSYDGTRTPGYPAFLALLDPAHEGWEARAWQAQMVVGVLITLLLFYLGWQVSGKPWLGGAVALAHTLNLGQVLFEANLLTETLTTFWVMLTFAGLAVWLYHPALRSYALAFGIGLAAALSAITRPLFIYLPAWILLFVLFTPNTQLATRTTNRILHSVLHGLAFVIPVVAILGGWVNFIHSHYGDWGLSTMTGYHLIQHTGNYFEYVPDDYAALRDTYLKYREIQITRHGSQTNAIWEAIPEMTQASGLHFYDLNRALAKISIQLIREHPDLYLKNVLEGWWMFWRAPVYWQPEALHWPGAAAPLRIVVLCERALLFGSNLVFIVASALAAFRALYSFILRRPSSSLRHSAFLWCLLGSIWMASIVQTLLDHGDNPRFLIPLQSLVVLWVLWLAAGWKVTKR